MTVLSYGPRAANILCIHLACVVDRSAPMDLYFTFFVLEVAHESHLLLQDLISHTDPSTSTP
jgi:hypothetical protein